MLLFKHSVGNRYTDIFLLFHREERFLHGIPWDDDRPWDIAYVDVIQRRKAEANNRRIQRGLPPLFDHHLTKEEWIAKWKPKESFNQDIRSGPPREHPPPGSKKQREFTMTCSRHTVPEAFPGIMLYIDALVALIVSFRPFVRPT